MTQKSGILGLLTNRLQQKIAGKNLYRGDRLRLQGRLQQAASAYRHAITMNPLETAAWFNLAETLADLTQWESAVECYRRVLELDMDYLPALRGLSKALFHSGQYQKLLEDEFNRSDLGVEFFTVFDSLGDALFKKNMIPDSILAYQKAHQLVPNSWQVLHKLGRALLKTGEFQQAEVCFCEVIDLNPDYNWAFDGLGDAHRFQHQWDRSAEAFRRAIELDPDYHWHHFKLGEVLMQSGFWDQASNAYRQCHRIDPFLPGLSDRQQEVEFNLKQWSKLEAYCQQQTLIQSKSTHNRPEDDARFLLLIAAQPPYPPTGGANRLLEQIKYLGDRHRLVVVCFHYSEYETEIRAILERYCEFSFLARPGGRKANQREDIPEKVKDLTTCDVWNALSRLATLAFDQVLFDFIFTTGYLELFADHYRILQEHNIESRILQQLIEQLNGEPQAGLIDTLGYDEEKLRLECDRLFAYENVIWTEFNLRVTTSEIDKEIMAGRCGSEILVVDNGVDTRAARPVDHQKTGPILFVGHLSYAPNIDAVHYFVKEILPRVLAQDSAARFLIAGRKPHDSVLALSDHPQVEVIADPETIKSVADRCSMTVVPLRMGSGTRLKILESFSMSLPVVSTSLGCEGLGLIDTEHLCVADTPEKFADAVLRLRSDESLSMRLRVSGRKLVKQHFDWSHIFASYERELHRRIGKTPA